MNPRTESARWSPQTQRLLPQSVCALLILLAACGPFADAAINGMDFSPDGRYVAVLTDQGGLYVLNAATGTREIALTGDARDDRSDWDAAGQRLAAVMDRGRGWDIWLVGATEPQTRLTLHPAADCSPQFTPGGKSLIFVTTREKDSDLYTFDIETLEARPFVARPHDQWGALIRPGQQAVAYFTMETGLLELWLAAPGQEPFSIAALDPFGHFPLEPAASWSADAGRLLYVVHDREEDRLEAYDPEARTVEVLARAPELARPTWSPQAGCLYYRTGEGLVLQRTSGFRPFGFGKVRRLTVRDTAVERAALSLESGSSEVRRLAAALEGDGLALGLTPARDFRLYFLSLDDQLDYVRRLATAGEIGAAETIYESLEAAGLPRSDVAHLRFHRLATLRGSGHPDLFHSAIESLVNLPEAALEPRDAAALQAESALFEYGDLEAARSLLTQAGDASTGAPFQPDTALRVLETDDEHLVESYVDAHVSLRRDDPGRALSEMRRALRARAPSDLVVHVVLELLDDAYDRESRADWGSRFQAAGLSERVADLLERLLKRMDREEYGPSPAGDRAAVLVERLRYLVLSGQYREARRCASDLLAQPEGFRHFDAENLLANFIHGDRPDAWARDLLENVFLHPDLEADLEAAFSGMPDLEVLETLARIKLAILQGDVATAAPLLSRAVRRLREVRDQDLASDIGPLRVHLHIWEAKCHELVGNWEAALSAYGSAQTMVLSSRPDWTALYLRVQAAAAEMAAGLERPEVLERLTAIESQTCDFLLESETNRDLLRRRARLLRDLLAETTPSPLDTFLLFRIGTTLSQGQMTHYATHYLDRALDAAPPDPLRPAILWEKASLLGAAERYWLQWRTCAALLEIGEGPVVADAARLQVAGCMLKLGLASRAIALLDNIRASTPIPAFDEAALQMQESLNPPQ